MEKQEYLIGDVAELTGISRDALRFYEKKGIITSHKKENGYRYYTSEDIFWILDVLFRRKMNLSLDEIDALSNRDSSHRSILELTRQKIAEEKKALEYHRQLLVKLKMIQDDCRRIDKNLNRFSIGKFESSYVLSRHECFDDSVIKWFQLTGENPGLELMYIYRSYMFRDSAVRRGDIYLVLKQRIARQLGLGKTLRRHPPCRARRCVYSVITSKTREPDEKTIQRTFDWADEHGIKVRSVLYSNYLICGNENGEKVYYIELYLPCA